eukprot:EG_transcript_14206
MLGMGNATAGPFCSPDSTVMRMMGFQTAGQATEPCLVFFVKEWRLADAGAFAGACVGVFLMAVLTEWLASIRRLVKDRFAKIPPEGRALRRLPGLVMLGLYGLQMTVGYLLMLVAMTYQAELFIMVIVGLVVGHGLFNLNASMAEPSDGCCQGQLLPGQGQSRCPCKAYSPQSDGQRQFDDLCVPSETL